MSFLHKIFGNNNKTSVPTSNDALFSVISGVFTGDDDFDCDGATVVNISNDVFSVVTKIAQTISDLPIQSNNQYLQDLINKNPNPNQTGKSLIASIVLNLLIYGDAYCAITIDKKSGLVNRLDLLPSSQVTINVNDNSNTYTFSGTGQTFNENQILRFSMPSVNGIYGLSPLYSLKNILRLSRASDKTLHEFYQNGLFGKSILTVNDNLSDDQKQQVKEQFKRNLQNSGYGGSIIQDQDYITGIKPYSTSSGNNAGFIKDTKTINDQIKRDVCSAYGVPSSLLVINSHANTSDEMSRFHSDIICYEKIIENELSRKLSGTWTMGNFININTPTDIANLGKAGMLSPAQAQTLLGLPLDNDFNNKVNNSSKK